MTGRRIADIDAHAHKREEDDSARLRERVNDHDIKIDAIIVSQREMTESIKNLGEKMGRIADVLEAWSNVQGFLAVMKFMSATVKTIWPIFALFAAILLFVKTGKWAGIQQ